MELTEDDWLTGYMTKKINMFACEETITEESAENNVSSSTQVMF